MNNKFPSTNIYFLDIIKLQKLIQKNKEPIKWSIVKSPNNNFLIFLLYHPDNIFNDDGQIFYNLLGRKEVNYNTESFDNSFQCIEKCIEKCGNVSVLKEDLFCFGQDILYMIRITMKDDIFIIDGDYFLHMLQNCLDSFDLKIKSLKLINEKQLANNEFYLLLSLRKNIANKEEKNRNLSVCNEAHEINEPSEYKENNIKINNKQCWKETGLTILQLTTIAIFSGVTAIWGYNLL